MGTAVSGSIAFNNNTGLQTYFPEALFALIAGIELDPNTGKGYLRNDGSGNALILQTPPDGDLVPSDEIMIFPDFGSIAQGGSWDFETKNFTSSFNPMSGAPCIRTGQSYTINMVSVAGRRVRLQLRVNSNGKAPADRRAGGDLTLVIESSEVLQ